MRGLAIRATRRPARQVRSCSPVFAAAFGMLVLLVASCSLDDRTLSAREPSNDPGRAGTSNQGGTGGKGTDTGGGAPVSGSAGEHEGQGSSGEGGQSPLDPGQCPDSDENSVPDCQETVVANSTFDQSTADWLAEDNVSQAWYEDDADTRAGSGSLAVVNFNLADIPNLSIGGSKQCVSVSGGGRYLYQMQVLIAKGQGSKGSAGFNVQFYEAADCSGKKLENFGGTSPQLETQGAWLPLEFEAEAPINAASMLVQLVVIKAFKEGSLRVLFDNVLVKPKEH